MTVASPTPSPDARAEEIFSHARAAIAARAFPSTMKYAVRISGYRKGAWVGRTYDTFEDWPEGSLFARSISEEEAAHPAAPPQGLNFFGLGEPKRSPLELPGVLGFPKLAVTYAFGLEGRAPSVEATPTPSATGLKSIYTARALSRIYDVRLDGEETIDDERCFHLTLRPLGNPGIYRVRELWVDEDSYQTRRLVMDGNFTGKETGSGKWTVNFVRAGDTWYLSSETSDKPGDDDGGHYDRVAVEFLNVTADPRENLDFGISGSANDVELTEPSEANGRT